MKSFKKQILKKGVSIKAQKPTTGEINSIIDRIEKGSIYMPEGNNKQLFAEAIAKQNDRKG